MKVLSNQFQSQLREAARSGNWSPIPEVLHTAEIAMMPLSEAAGETALHHAAQAGKLSSVPAGMRTAESMMAKDRMGITPFRLAWDAWHARVGEDDLHEIMGELMVKLHPIDNEM